MAQYYEEVSAMNIRMVAESIYANGQYNLTAMFANDERSINGCFAIYCIFFKSNEYKIVKGVFKKNDRLEYPSLTPIIFAADWYEREIFDLFGIMPLEHPDLRPLVLHENWPEGHYPMRKDFSINSSIEKAAKAFPMPQVVGEGVFEVPVGPIHAGIIEPGHFRFSQAGEHIINLEAKLFFTHRGIEKAVEGLPFSKAFYQAERICGTCSVSHAISYAEAVESLAGTEVSDKAKYLRMLVAELERLYNHIGDAGNLCAGVGFAPGVSHGSRLREELMRLNEHITGNRFLRGMIALGGANLDISKQQSHEILSTLRRIENDLRELVDIVKDNQSFLDRINATGVLSKKIAKDLAVVGVAARASGIDTDLRRDYPYLSYQEMDFKIPVYMSGDVAARLWVRIDEAFESMSLIRQILSRLPEMAGVLKNSIRDITPYTMGFGSSESPRGSNIHWVMAGENNTIYRYFVRSASYPNWPALTFAVPGNIIPDFPLINKSFELCYACIDR